MRQKPKKNPQSKPPSFWEAGAGPIAIAHRGGDGAGAKKENTIAAFAAAWDMGYSYSETDTILTADGQLIAVHGSTNLWDSLLRGRHSRRRLQHMSFARIRKKFDVGGEQVPTLEEVLTSQPKMKFFIDPKTEEAVKPLVELLKNLKVTDRVCVDSFNYHRLVRFRKLMGKDVPATSFVIGRAFRVINQNKHMLETGRLNSIEAVQLHHSLISRQMVDLVHRQGFRAIVWTTNSEIAIKNAINCGADGVISDRVGLLKEVINSKKPTL